MVLALVAAGTASAQPVATPGGAAQASDATARRAADRVEKHIDELHRRLSITPAQQEQWDAFATVLRQNAQAVEQVHAANQPRQAASNALDDLRTYTARARMHAANLDRLLPVFEALYTSMSADQRGVADKTFREFQRRQGADGRP